MKERILLYGAGGHSKVVVDVVEKEGKYDIAGIIDDKHELQGRSYCGYRVIGGFDRLREKDCKSCMIVIAIAYNNIRERLYKRVELLGYDFVSVIHPSAQIARDVLINHGTMIMANAVINTNTEIGKGAVINTGVIIEHDCKIGDFSHIASGAHIAGAVTVGESSFIGIGSCIIEFTRIGKKSVIGAGAVVIDDIPGNVTAVGIPAKVIMRNKV
jgi:acetyltransferase EpsM